MASQTVQTVKPISTELIKQQALTNRQKSKPIEQLIQASLKELGKALPSHLNAERLVRIALTTIRQNPKLAECSPMSFLGALFQAAQLGLEPNVEGQAYINPYLNNKKIIDENGKTKWIKVLEAQFQIGYKGYIELFYRHEAAEHIDMHAVHEHDRFEYLKWSNVEFEYGFIELLETKSGKSRKVPISSKLMKVLEEAKNDTEYVFINPDTNMPYNDIKKSFHTVLKKAGIEDFRFHDFRHTAATRMLEKGADIRTVQEILGHSSVSVTERYTHTNANKKKSAIELLSSF